MLGLLSGVSIVALLGSPWLAHEFLAKNDIAWTIPAEGTVKAIMRGGPYGRLVRFTPAPSGKQYAGESDPNLPIEDFWEIIPRNENTPEREPSWFLEKIEHRFGWSRVGLPGARAVHRYPFSYGKIVVEEDAKGNPIRRVIRRPETESDFIVVVSHSYGIIVSDAETSDGFKMRIDIQMVGRITNPYKSNFGINTNWLGTIENIIAEIVKDYISPKKFLEVWDEKTSEYKSGELTDMICEAIEKCEDEGEKPSKADRIEKDYGFKIEDISVINIDPADEEDRKVATQILRAKVDADALKERTGGRVDEIERVGQAEAEALRKKLTAISENPEAARLDALKAAGEGGGLIVASGDDGLLKAAAAKMAKGEGEQPKPTKPQEEDKS